MKNILNLTILLLFLGLVSSCDKIDTENSSSVITLVVENNTSEDFENFTFTTFDIETESEKLQEFGSIESGKSAEIIFDSKLEYMHYGDVEEYMHFGNKYTAVINGVEMLFNHGFCGTGLIFDEAETGTFVTKVNYIDYEYNWLGIEQKKL